MARGYYWYGNKRKGPGRPPKWVEKILSDADKEGEGKPHEEPGNSVTDVEETGPTMEPVGPERIGQELTEHESNNRMSGRYLLRRDPKPPERLC